MAHQPSPVSEGALADLAVLLADWRREPRARLLARVAQEGRACVLDAPDLTVALAQDRRFPGCPLPVLLYVVRRRACRDVGIVDDGVVVYVRGMLHDFAFGRRAYRVAPVDDEEFQTLADLALAVEQSPRARRLVARVHLGNLALWLSGLFPDWVATRQRRRGGPGASYYDAMGQRGFALAAAHPDVDVVRRDLYETLHAVFPTLRLALNRARDAHWFPHVHSQDKLLRQIAALWSPFDPAES